MGFGFRVGYLTWQIMQAAELITSSHVQLVQADGLV